MSLMGRRLLVILCSLMVGVVLFVLSFVFLDFIWTHVVVTHPGERDLGDGIMVVGGGLVIGTTLGLGALVFMLYRFWPKKPTDEAR